MNRNSIDEFFVAILLFFCYSLLSLVFLTIFHRAFFSRAEQYTYVRFQFMCLCNRTQIKKKYNNIMDRRQSGRQKRRLSGASPIFIIISVRPGAFNPDAGCYKRIRINNIYRERCVRVVLVFALFIVKVFIH